MSKRTRYPRIEDGDGVRLKLGKYGNKSGSTVDIHPEDSVKFACCDCGMVHKFIPIRLSGSEIRLHITREDRSTAQLRRNRFGNLHQGVGKWRIVDS